MSLNPRVISSDHYGAPVITGENWGMLINMLRKTLVEGFNLRDDVRNIKITSRRTLDITFENPPTYVKDQTILLINAPINLSTEFIVYSVIGNKLLCESYVDLPILENNEFSGLSEVSCKVAPLGFTEEFSDGDRGAFCVNEPEKNCYLYVDDTLPDPAWPKYMNILPLVYMTDKMTDINTPGKTIVPFDPASPEKYRTKYWSLPNGNKKTGMWHFPSFMGPNNNNAGTEAMSKNPTGWIIIGNDQHFYLLMTYFAVAGESLGNARDHLYQFGKFKSNISNDKGNYYLNCNSLSHGTYPDTGFEYRYHKGLSVGPSGSKYTNSLLGFDNSANMTSAAILKSFVNNKPVEISLVPVGISLTDNYGYTSGSANGYPNYTNSMNYPDRITEKFTFSRVTINDNNNTRGVLPGLMWKYIHGPFINKTITRHRYKDSSRRLFHIRLPYMKCNTVNIDQSFAISLNLEDWT